MLKQPTYFLPMLCCLFWVACGDTETAHTDLPPGEEEHDTHIAWGYTGETGPAQWGSLDAEFATCGSGTEQSPIALTGATAADLPPLQFDYVSADALVQDTGHSVHVDVAGGMLTVGSAAYNLVQFHFHAPSEHTVDGETYAAVVHLVHADSTSNLAVVGVLFNEGAAHPLIETLWSRLPGMLGAGQAVAISADDLLPEDRSYYTYPGSLTTPPCTEGVRWLVLRTPVELSAAQLATLTQFYDQNVRPVQPLNDRELQVMGG